jgi:hypothetical protein
MEPTTARNAVGADGNHQDGAPAVPAAGSRGRAAMFVLTAAAALALAVGAVTGTPPNTAASVALAHAGTSTAINCPPPHPEATPQTGDISDC